MRNGRNRRDGRFLFAKVPAARRTLAACAIAAAVLMLLAAGLARIPKMAEMAGAAGVAGDSARTAGFGRQAFGQTSAEIGKNPPKRDGPVHAESGDNPPRHPGQAHEPEKDAVGPIAGAPAQTAASADGAAMRGERPQGGRTSREAFAGGGSPELLVALGDSIALGIGDETGGGYVERLRAGLEAVRGREIRAVNLGVNGLRSDQLLKRLDEKPDILETVSEAGIITVSVGGNDLARIVKKHVLELEAGLFEEGRTRFAEHLSSIITWNCGRWK